MGSGCFVLNFRLSFLGFNNTVCVYTSELELRLWVLELACLLGLLLGDLLFLLELRLFLLLFGILLAEVVCLGLKLLKGIEELLE